MKKLILLLTIVALATISKAQVTIPKDSALVTVGSEWKYVTHVNYLNQKVSVPVNQDSVIYTYSSFPNELIENRLELQGDYWVGDTCFTYTNQSHVRQTYGGRLVLYQRVIKKVMQAREKSVDEKIWYLTKYAKKNGYNNVQFYNATVVDTLIHRQ